jgi:hypothetical protein
VQTSLLLLGVTRARIADSAIVHSGPDDNRQGQSSSFHINNTVRIGSSRVAALRRRNVLVTRSPVRVLEQYRRLGLSEAALLQNFPTLRAQDLANAWAYVQARRGEIDDLIRRDAEDA